MKSRVVVIFNPVRDRWTEARAMLASAGHSDWAAESQREFGYTLRFESEEAWIEFLRTSAEHGFPESAFFVRRDPVWSSTELREAALLLLTINSKPVGTGGPSLGTEFDMTRACHVCGTGAVQVGPLRLGRDLPASNKPWQTLDGEVLLPVTWASALSRSSGLELRQAVAADSKETLPWVQIMPSYEMPSMAPTTEGIYQRQDGRVSACRTCRRDGYFTRLTQQIRYRPEDLEAAPDFSQTYERFGRSVLVEPFVNSHFATPLILMRPAAYEILSAAPRNMVFRPVLSG